MKKLSLIYLTTSTICAIFLCLSLEDAYAASQNVFADCDGYGVPSANGDGMTKEARGFFGLFAALGSAGTTRKTNETLSTTGVSACDNALADARLRPSQWLRKVSLLRAKAMHHLVVGNSAAAIADLDAAQSSIPQSYSIYFARSLGVGLDYVRAYALRQLGRQKEAEELAMKAFRVRPYSSENATAALIAIGPEASQENLELLLRYRARTDPSSLYAMFDFEFESGQYANAAAIFPQLGDADWESPLGGMIERNGKYIFALVAAGRNEEADELIPRFSRTRQGRSIEGKSVDSLPDPSTLDAKIPTHDTQKWINAINLRKIINSRNFEQYVKIDIENLPLSYATIDSLHLLGSNLGYEDKLKLKFPDIEKIYLNWRKFLFGSSDKQIKVLFQTLPETESQDRIPSSKKISSEILRGVFDGRSARPSPVEGQGEAATIVKFRAEQSPVSVTEELALLKAGEFARAKGFRGLVVLKAQNTQWTLNSTYFGATIRSDPYGFETELYVRFVDPDKLPQEFYLTPWRVVNIDTIRNNLAPIYLMPTTVTGATTPK